MTPTLFAPYLTIVSSSETNVSLNDMMFYRLMCLVKTPLVKPAAMGQL